jgi:chromosome segregation and condensation protein ScpB
MTAGGWQGRINKIRHCERSEAIQTVSAEGFWIASLRSQRREGKSA